MRRVTMVLSILFAAGAGVGGFVGLPGPWLGVAALLAAVSATAALLVGDRGESADSANRTPVHAPVSRPSAARTHRQPDDRHDSDIQALRVELEKHKQMERVLVVAKHASVVAMIDKGLFIDTMRLAVRSSLN